MADQDPQFRVCPTRIDSTRVLFAHKVATNKCQERQRELYHKCFTCAWNNNYVSANGAPQIAPERVTEDPPATSQVG